MKWVKLSLRQTYGFCFLFIIVLIGGAVYLEVHDGLNPCPLCLMQRYALLLLGFCFFIGLMLKPDKKWNRIVAGICWAVSLCGILIAGRQIWLQFMPNGAALTCMGSLSYMLSILPLSQVILNIFKGTADCTQNNWSFMYLNLAEWSFLSFSLLLYISIMQYFRKDYY